MVTAKRVGVPSVSMMDSYEVSHTMRAVPEMLPSALRVAVPPLGKVIVRARAGVGSAASSSATQPRATMARGMSVCAAGGVSAWTAVRHSPRTRLRSARNRRLRFRACSVARLLPAWRPLMVPPHIAARWMGRAWQGRLTEPLRQAHGNLTGIRGAAGKGPDFKLGPLIWDSLGTQGIHRWECDYPLGSS